MPFAITRSKERRKDTTLRLRKASEGEGGAQDIGLVKGGEESRSSFWITPRRKEEKGIVGWTRGWGLRLR